MALLSQEKKINTLLVPLEGGMKRRIGDFVFVIKQKTTM